MTTAVFSALWRPAWCRPAAIDYSRLPADRRDLTNLIEQVSAALNARRETEVAISVAQLDRWLAARRELDVWTQWPTELDQVESARIREAAGAIEIGATTTWSGVRVPVRASFQPSIKDGELCVDVRSAHVGALPAPVSLILSALPRPTARFRAAGSTIRLRSDWTWPNGRQRCHIRRIWLSDGILRMTIAPGSFE